jgi:hypothetical protein
VTRVWHSFFGLVRLPGRPTTVRILIVALVLAAISWYFGADVWYSILLGVALTTVGLICFVGAANPGLASTDWRGGDSRNWDGARGDVAELAWRLRDGHGRVSSGAAWRVRDLARQRLARYRLDLVNPADRPRIEQLIGRSAYLVVVRSSRRPPSLRLLIRCLDALDALDSMPSVQPPSGSRRRLSIFTLHRPRRVRER